MKPSGNGSAMELNDGDRLQPMSYQIFATTHLVLFVIALLLNSSAILSFTTNKALFVPENYLLISMVISDLLTTCLATSVGAYANYQRWWTLNDAVCQMFAFVATCCGLVSIWHHVALAIQRLVAFKFFMTCKISPRKMILAVLICWVAPIVYSSLPLFGWSSFGPEPGFIGCSVTWYSKNPLDLSYVMTMFVLFFFVPLIVTAICYVCVHKEMKAMTRKAAITWGNSAQQTAHTLRAQKRNVTMSVVMSSAFIMAWTPYALLSFYTTFGGKISSLSIAVSASFAKLSSCYNVIVYIFSYRRFRKTFYGIVVRILGTRGNTMVNYVREKFHNVRTLAQKNHAVSDKNCSSVAV